MLSTTKQDLFASLVFLFSCVRKEIAKIYFVFLATAVHSINVATAVHSINVATAVQSINAVEKYFLVKFLRLTEHDLKRKNSANTKMPCYAVIYSLAVYMYCLCLTRHNSSLCQLNAL